MSAPMGRTPYETRTRRRNVPGRACVEQNQQGATPKFIRSLSGAVLAAASAQNLRSRLRAGRAGSLDRGATCSRRALPSASPGGLLPLFLLRRQQVHEVLRRRVEDLEEILERRLERG